MRKNIWTIVVGMMLAVVLTCASVPGGFLSTPADATQLGGGFSCYTYDGQGHVLNGYCPDGEQTWYLFVTSTQAAQDVVVYYTGAVTDASAGTLDTNSKQVSGAFAASGDTLSLTLEDESVVQVVLLQSTLPSVYVDLEGTTLEDIHADKDKKHKGNSIYISDLNETWDLQIENEVEIKGRGNSTWREYEKKAYQIKFDKKTSVLGMGKAKKWILLANASDDSMLRSKLAYDTAKCLDMAYVTSFEFVDLWVEGEYLGTYLLGEKVEPGDARLKLENDAGALFEHDQDFYLDEDYWFFSDVLDRYFTMKEIVEEEDALIEAAMADFEESVNDLANYLYSTPSQDVTLEDLSQMIDVDSFVKYYLMNEYTLNRESFSTSFYWYKDGPDDVIHLGPVWDFDTCMGNDGEAYTESYGENHTLFHYLLAAPAFRGRVIELLEVYSEELNAMSERVDELEAQIASSAEMNYVRWDVLGKPNPKGGEDFYPTFEEAVDALHTWLQGRETSFAVPECCAVTAKVSGDYYELSLRVDDGKEHDSVIFSVWSKVNGRDDVRWYPAKVDEDGVWRATVDLGNHNSAGIYYIGAYTDDQQVLVGSGKCYVEEAREPRYLLSMEIPEAGTLKITLTDVTQTADAVRFAVWGVMVGQESTLKWFDPVETTDGVWEISIPLCGFNVDVAETFAVHVYGNIDGETVFLNETQSHVAIPAAHKYANGRECVACGFVNEEIVIGVPMYRLYNPNSGEHFYTGSPEERDILAAAGWVKEGIGFHVPETSTVPVHRLYHPVLGDHMYTVNEAEMAELMSSGWNYEGIAFYSASDAGAPLYRVHNPNATAGAWHFTGSTEERDMLVAAGWIYEGIAWYSLRQDQAHNHEWSVQWQADETNHWHECKADGCFITENSGKDGYGTHRYSDAADTTCNDCGYVRQVSVSSAPMFRMYNPNSGQHFYTGSEVERDNLVLLGWVYEGVGFNFPTVSDIPVYRLYSAVRLSHIYTASEVEKDRLVSEGWNYEGIAFYSVGNDGAAQYRLYNPNAVSGAWHYTSSVEERDMLINAGWTYEGIGWYSLWS